jgi:hypothetical protein
MKAQTSLVFVFILAVLIIGLITLIAYKGIAEITKKSDETLKVQFINDIKADINSLRRMRDSSEVFSYKLPSTIEKVCFVKTCGATPLTDCSTVYAQPMPAQLMPYKSQKPQKNIFLLTKEGVSDAIETGAMEINYNTEASINPPNKCAQNFCCFETPGRLNVRFTGTGDKINATKE